MTIIKDLPREPHDHEPVALDVEIYKMNETRLHRPSGTFAALSVAFHDAVYQITDVHDIPKVLGILAPGLWIMHNSTFDVAHLRRWANIPRRQVWDSLLIEQDLFGGYYDTFALDDLSRRWLGKMLPKEAREQFADRSDMTPEMEQYAADDASATLAIYEKQKQYMADEGEDLKCYWEIDEPAVWAVLDMPPVKVNVDGWRAMAVEHAAKTQTIADALGFNPGSYPQTKKTIKGVLGQAPKDTRALTLQTLMLGSQGKAKDLLAAVLEYRMYKKASSTYGERWLEENVEEGDLVYPGWRVTGAETGRMSCIAQGSLVDAPRNLLLHPKGIPIEHIQVGAYVYAMDQKGIPRPRAVTHKHYAGERQVLKLVWRASGSKSYLGELKATADHLVRLRNGTYKRMDELKPNDRLSFLSRSMDTTGRAYLRWGEDRKTIEHRHLLPSSREAVVHHINWIPQDNSLDNLMLISPADHRKLHSHGRMGQVWSCPYDKDAFEHLVAGGARKAVTTSGHDYLTLQRWAVELDIEIPDHRRHKYKRANDLPTNHFVVMVVSEEEVLPVWDLTIAEDENFIVNEIAVHNCRGPNLRQIPARRIPKFREMFLPRKKRLIVADVVQQEPCIAGWWSKDEVLLDVLTRGGDIYESVMEATALDRFGSKTIFLGSLYGLSDYGLASRLHCTKEEAATLLRKLLGRFKGVAIWQHKTKSQAYQRSYVLTPSGRKIWLNLYNKQWEKNAVNSPIQGGAADQTKIALGYLHTMGVLPCLVVHDELVVDSDNPKHDAKIVRDAWIEAGKKIIPGVPVEAEVLIGRNWGVKQQKETPEEFEEDDHITEAV